MGKVVISWIGFHRDFRIDGKSIQVDANGPTIRIHSRYYKHNNYTTHYLLQCRTSPGSDLDRKVKSMKRFIEEQYKTHRLNLYLLNIEENDLSNYDLVVAQLRNFLSTLNSADDIEVITGTGTEILKMAWITLFYSMNLYFNLLLMHHDLQRYPDLIPIPLKKSKILDDKLKEIHIGQVISKSLVSDSSLDEAYERGQNYAKAVEQNVLILGETGTGKGELAKFVFENSPLKDKPYLSINCASLPEDTMLYSELFGHVEGAFTGAMGKRDGLFLKCKGGTLFMDEVGDISYKMQLSLLRAIENGEIKPLGSDALVTNVNVRIIAATNSDLYEKCEQGKFRWDLFYRLHDCVINLPSFRDRSDKDRRRIIAHFIKSAEKKWGRSLKLSEEAETTLFSYIFPGNFRELKNTVNSLFALDKKVVSTTDLPAYFMGKDRVTKNLEDLEKNMIEKTYRESNFNIAETARRLGISNQHKFKIKMQKLGVQVRPKDGKK